MIYILDPNTGLITAKLIEEIDNGVVVEIDGVEQIVSTNSVCWTLEEAKATHLDVFGVEYKDAEGAECRDEAKRSKQQWKPTRNMVTLTGNLSKPPVFFVTKTGFMQAHLRIAVREERWDREQQKYTLREEPDWFDICLVGEQALQAVEQIAGGDLVTVVGVLKTKANGRVFVRAPRIKLIVRNRNERIFGDPTNPIYANAE